MSRIGIAVLVGGLMAASLGVHAQGVTITRAFHRDGQTYLVWEEVAGASGYHLYRSHEPITEQSIGALEPLELNGDPFVVPQGSAQMNVCAQFHDPRPFGPSFVPETVHDFSSITGWNIDGIGAEVTETFAAPVPAGHGFAVWTPAAGLDWQGAGAYHYAVVAVGDGTLGTASTVTVEETADRLRPTMIWQSADRTTRLFVHYMPLQRSDGPDWNPLGYGYGLHYAVEVPADYDYSDPEPLPVMIPLHGLGGQQYVSYLSSDTRYIRISPNDRLIAWWYGWSATHDYSTHLRQMDNRIKAICEVNPAFAPPTTGPIVNYMEQALMRTIFDVADHPDYRVDEHRVFLDGASMGATGALNLGVRYPGLFSAVVSDKPALHPRVMEQPGTVCNQRVSENPQDYCNEPILMLQGSFANVFGAPELDLPIVNQSPYLGATARPAAAAHLTRFDGLAVYDWLDSLGMLEGVRRNADGEPVGPIVPSLRGAETAYLMIAFAFMDCATSWDNQGRPAVHSMQRSRLGFSVAVEDKRHQLERHEYLDLPWPEFIPPVPRFASPNFGFLRPIDNRFRDFDYPSNLSFPAIVNDAQPLLPKGRAVPSGIVDCPTYVAAPQIPPMDALFLNLNIRWRGEGLDPIIDTPTQWSVHLRTEARVLVHRPGQDFMLTDDAVTRSITPRRTQQFRPGPNDFVGYTVTDAAGEVIASGMARREDGHVTAPDVLITPEGTRVTLAIVDAPPVTITRSFHRNGQTFLVWDELPGAAGYHLYRSREPITAESITTMEPLELNGLPFVILQGSAAMGDCHEFQDPKNLGAFLPPTIHDFTPLVNWVIDPVGEETRATFATEVPDGSGFVVWTPAAGRDWQGDGEYHYAVTPIGTPVVGPLSTVAVEEAEARLRPLLVWQSDTGRTRLYLQYMALQRHDTVDWNPRGIGYANYYTVEVPSNYDFATPERLPVMVSLHPGTSNSQASYLSAQTRYIRVTPNDRLNTWWYGWSATHDYTGRQHRPDWANRGICLGSLDFSPPTTGPIVNYTEGALMRALADVADLPQFSIDEDRIFADGMSMGATGAFNLGVRYPNVFTATLADKPPINPRVMEERGVVCNVLHSDDANNLCNEPIMLRQNSFDLLLGTPTTDLPIINQSPYLGTTDRTPVAAHLTRFDGLSVFDWMDSLGMLEGVRRAADGTAVQPVTPSLVGAETAYLMVTWGYRDCATSWDNQGRPAWTSLQRARVGFSGSAEDLAHQLERYEYLGTPWPEYIPPVPRYASPNFGFLTSVDNRYRDVTYPRTRSFPAITEPTMTPLPEGRPIPHGFPECPTHDPSNPTIPPIAPRFFNLNINWTATGLLPIEDTPTQWRVHLRTESRTLANPPGQNYVLSNAAVVRDITPRRTQNFRVLDNDLIRFTVTPQGEMPYTGIAVIENGLATARNVRIVPGGTVLTFRRFPAARQTLWMMQ